ncbi:unnamed protein product [Phytophthora lilii]|uniref:Unnamed protein product n=1 Tax=Phytophthora lilii TaxID=2077276 RepID=A0A9W6WNU0_9STRA|nr:unnamed protein product [Phytophthora lilii]
MDPFGDGNPVEGGEAPADISDFAPPADNTGECVEPTEGQSFEQQAYEQPSYEEHTDFGAPAEQPADFQQEAPAPVEIPAQIPVVEDNELTYVAG